MREATGSFAGVIEGSHLSVVRVDVLFNRQVILEGAPVVDGTITYDRTAAVLARLDCTLADPTRLPLTSDDIYTPFGYELRVWRGVGIDPGAGAYLTLEGSFLMLEGTFLTWGNPETLVELVALGTFPIQRSSIDGVSLATGITAEDRSRLVSDARFEDDYQIAAGTNYADAIEAMISDGVTGLTYLFPSTTLTTPLLTFSAQDDRWEAAQGMARSLGMWIYFDGLGNCVMRPEPTFTDDPVTTISEGEGGNLVDITYDLDRTAAYNRVVAFSSNAALTAPVRGVATDDDPSSPTYYFGPFGRKPRFYASPFISEQAQADEAAAAILRSQLGVAASLSYAIVPDPRLEMGDVVHVTREALGVDDVHILERGAISLGPESPMPLSSRARQVSS